MKRIVVLPIVMLFLASAHASASDSDKMVQQHMYEAQSKVENIKPAQTATPNPYSNIKMHEKTDTNPYSNIKMHEKTDTNPYSNIKMHEKK